MSSYEHVLKSRLLTEKSSDLLDSKNIVSFEVDIKASKKDVAAAVQKLFEVKPLKVRTLTVRGKVKRRGAKVFKRGNYKKALVWLAEGQKIKAFEEA